MKKILLIILSVLLLSVGVGLLVGCGETPEDKTYTITFKQDGYDDFSITLKEGESLLYEDMPNPQIIPGYSVYWDIPEIKNVSTDMIVTCQKSPRHFKVYFNFNNALLDSTVRESFLQSTTGLTKGWESNLFYLYYTFGTEFALPLPTEDFIACEFYGWKMQGSSDYVQNGVLEIYDNVILYGDWSEVEYEDIIFRQEGFEDVTRKVPKGMTYSKDNYPPVNAVKGHNVEWEEVDLSRVIDTVIVNAIATPNTYRMYFDKGVLQLNSSNKIEFGETLKYDSVSEKYYKEIVYGTDVSLPSLTVTEGSNVGSTLLGFKIDGETDYYEEIKYLTYDHDIYLTAVWDIVGTPPPIS